MKYDYETTVVTAVMEPCPGPGMKPQFARIEARYATPPNGRSQTLVKLGGRNVEEYGLRKECAQFEVELTTIHPTRCNSSFGSIALDRAGAELLAATLLNCPLDVVQGLGKFPSKTRAAGLLSDLLKIARRVAGSSAPEDLRRLAADTIRYIDNTKELQ